MVWPRPKVFWLSKDDHTGHRVKGKSEEVDRGGGKTILKKG